MYLLSIQPMHPTNTLPSCPHPSSCESYGACPSSNQSFQKATVIKTAEIRLSEDAHTYLLSALARAVAPIIL